MSILRRSTDARPYWSLGKIANIVFVNALFFIAIQSVTSKDTCGATATPPQKLLNSAFVFVKPHANTEKVRELVAEKLESAGISILFEDDIGGEEIDRNGLIDQHYYSIASKATILPAEKIPVPPKVFRETFGEEWSKVLEENRAANALDACKRFGCSPEELNEAWNKVSTVKFGGGFYCGKVSVNGKPELYVFNAFFMTMRSKFVGKDNGIHCFTVEWDSDTLSWSSFRHEILGPTDPKKAPSNSIRRSILDQYKNLGLSSVPNHSDNGVHASASPFEALAEKLNWLSLNLESDSLGKKLLDAGISETRIKEWCLDPQIKTSDSSTGSLFDELEDLNVDDCVSKLLELNRLN
ncbi:unnamed protein product [Pseudo-nitzschia multistriata]|uniref:Nucleoside-diphosphate kinase n=1 Tax=Pseudo-nitzschia multistriata TaxID=183589 RepID=A0A448ZGH3_9STRA|nr:unnamed protein product [Pseudo-nitzschia multistriata]